MNLIQEISPKIDGKYYEDAYKSAHTSHGELKSQRVYCEAALNEHKIKLVANYQLGAAVLLTEDIVYTIMLIIPNEIKPIHFFPKSKWSKLFGFGIKNEIRKKYSVKTNSQTEKLLSSAKFEYLMLSYNVFISTKVNNDGTVISLYAHQPIGELSELEELLEIITIISNKHK